MRFVLNHCEPHPPPSSVATPPQDERVMRFVKYIGGSAPSSRWDVAVDFDVQVDDDDASEDAVSVGANA